MFSYSYNSVKQTSISKFPGNSRYWGSLVPGIQIVSTIPILHPLHVKHLPKKSRVDWSNFTWYDDIICVDNVVLVLRFRAYLSIR